MDKFIKFIYRGHITIPEIEEMQTKNTGSIKVVRFKEVVTVHYLISWSYAYRRARGGANTWIADRLRFNRRVETLRRLLHGGCSIQV